MPRGNRSQANARPDSDFGQRQERTQGGVVAERPGRTKTQQTADALVSVADTVSGIAQKQSAKAQKEEAKQQRLQAFKDFHADVNKDVDMEQAKERAEFGNEDYSRTYMRLSYSQQAKDVSADMAEQAERMMNDPEVGVDEVETYLDATASGAIQGVEDPEAVDVYANRLSSDAQKLKAEARDVAIKRQQQDGRAKLNAQIDDLAEQGVLGSADSMEILENAGAKLNVSQNRVHAMVANAAIRRAEESTDPSKLDFLFEENEDGVAIADNPELHDSLLRARDQIESEAEQRTSAAELTEHYSLRRKMESGALTMDDIQRVNREHPDWYSPNQLASMLSRSQDTARQAAARRREAAAATSGQVSPVSMRMKTHSEQQEVFGHMRRGIFSQHEETPEGRQQAFVDYATRVAELSGGVGGVKDDWLAAQLNAGAEAPSADGSMPDAFRAGYSRYRALKDDPRTRGLLDNLLRPDARRMYERVEAYERSGDYVPGDSESGPDLTPAYVKATRDLANPIDEKTFYSSESFENLRRTVGEVTDVSSFLGLGSDYGGDVGRVTNALDVKQDIRKMATREMRYARASLDQALETAKDRYKATHTLVRGTYIRGQFGSNATEAVNAKLAAELPAIQEGSGGDVEMDDLKIVPGREGEMVVFLNNSSPAIVDNGDGRTKPLTFDMAEAVQAYSDKVLSDANAERPTEADARAARPVPVPGGSPARRSSMVEAATEEDREAVRQSIADGLQAVRDKLTGQPPEQPPQGAPGGRY
ncbi:hypothetical protein [Salinisphaera orenii]|uniref:Uncharacterized protein n=1 Tax=Salinisphaera orenii YIM 95161 TaxID=1051139 RepID=A0A423PMG6_9GAMM|nr:hypothetical protein [Salinisphaera halophila]ROO26777.1 hypothetical protein SAHL_12445 [Salinisphaera halophila YIM 95161]